MVMEGMGGGEPGSRVVSRVVFGGVARREMEMGATEVVDGVPRSAGIRSGAFFFSFVIRFSFFHAFEFPFGVSCACGSI